MTVTMEMIKGDLQSAIDAIDCAPLDDLAGFRVQIEEARALVECADRSLKLMDCKREFDIENASLAGMA